MLYKYDIRQTSKENRRLNGIKACQIIKIDNEHGLTYKLPWGNDTSWIKPQDFGVGQYKVGEWIDLLLCTVSSQGHIYLQSEQFVGRTPEAFIPEK